MEKRNLISKIISMIFNLGFMAFIIVQLSMQVEYTSQIVAMFMMLSGAFKLIFFFLSGEYKHPVKLYETLTNPALIILGIIFMITKTDAVAVCITYGVIDMIDGLLGIGFRSIEIRNHALSVVEVALCLGDFVFGLILVLMRLEEIRGHLMYLALTMFVYTVLTVIEIIKERRKKEI